MKRCIIFSVICLSFFGLWLGCAPSPAPAPAPPAPAPAPPPAPAPAEVIQIRSLGCFPPVHAAMSFMPELIERINEACEGRVVWKNLGGPEVIPALDQFKALQSGVIEAIFAISGYYTSQVPEAYFLPASRLLPWEERESGLYDLVNELHQEANTFYLGRFQRLGFYVYTVGPFENLEDLNGRAIRSGGTLLPPWLKALGMNIVEIPFPETYTALQRGAVEGVSASAIGMADLGWCEVLRYALDHETLSASNAVVLVNLDVWNKIPTPVQDKITKVFAEAEYDMVADFESMLEVEKQKAQDVGVTFVKLSPEEGKRVVDTGYEECWKYQLSLGSPHYEQLRKLSGN